MSETLANKTYSEILWRTPTLTVIRAWRADHPNWKQRVERSPLPAQLKSIVIRIVRRTRLWPGEKSAVASEVTAHFLDGLEAGASIEELLRRFGSEKDVVSLIRRAKRRSRPLLWHGWIFMLRVTAVVICIYAVLLARFFIGRPSPSVNYLPKLNASAVGKPQSDLAWPLWKQAILESSKASSNQREFSDAIDLMTRVIPPWSNTVQWLNQHAHAIELARQAAEKPVLGFVIGSGGSQADLQIESVVPWDPGSHPLSDVPLPHLGPLREMANILSLDAKLAAQLRDGNRCSADLDAIIGLNRQLRGADGTLLTQLVAIGVNTMVVDRLQQILVHQPDLLTEAQLVQLAHALAGPQVAADLIDTRRARDAFADWVQHSYTDDGHGDGRVTAGVMDMLNPQDYSWKSRTPEEQLADITLPLLMPSRAQVMTRFDQLMTASELNMSRPLRDANWKNVLSQLRDHSRYGLVGNQFPYLEGVQTTCERYLGLRDGTLVGIALEVYRRRFRHYPLRLQDLSPLLLPHVPTDRITGDPVRYKLVDAQPIVYSVGADHVDDGGLRVDHKSPMSKQPEQWDAHAPNVPHGDWILYPPDPAIDP